MVEETKTVKLLIGEWYRSKRGHLFLVENIESNNSIIVTSHYTGNLFKLNNNQLPFVVGPVQAPKTPLGTAITTQPNEQQDDENGFNHIYNKYAHVILDSVYKVKNTGGADKKDFIKIEGKLRSKKRKFSVRGATRCKIACQTEGCNNTRDIKVQDAFQVKLWSDCKNKKRKSNLNKFIKGKKNEK